ncbi:MAG: hypothetical protein Q4F57_10140 [Weeksellaceae bacterium]|nr:hypothetical protein [Weeksellaceae bacterium]
MIAQTKKPKKPNAKKDKTQLFLVLSKQWFYEILAGTKKEEYREFTDHNMSRLAVIENGEFVGCRQYETVKFQLGYTKNPPQMIVEVKEITLDMNDPNAELLTIDNCNFTIKLGQVLEK